MSCKITSCVREKINLYCDRHQEAKLNLDEAFTKWQYAFGKKFTKRQFFEKLLDDDNLDVGSWVLDVVRLELEELKN